MVALPRPLPRLVGHDRVFSERASNGGLRTPSIKGEPAADICCCFIAGRQNYRSNPVKSRFGDFG
jgi:hypothetical protein